MISKAKYLFFSFKLGNKGFVFLLMLIHLITVFINRENIFLAVFSLVSSIYRRILRFIKMMVFRDSENRGWCGDHMEMILVIVMVHYDEGLCAIEKSNQSVDLRSCVVASFIFTSIDSPRAYLPSTITGL